MHLPIITAPLGITDDCHRNTHAFFRKKARRSQAVRTVIAASGYHQYVRIGSGVQIPAHCILYISSRTLH